MGQASQRKKILRPLDEIGLDKISDIEKALEESFGTEKAREILKEWEKRSEIADSSDTPGMQDELYNFLNSDPELSFLVTCYTDSFFIREICLWLYDRKYWFGEQILDVGCGNGIISCFLASCLPDSFITAIDRSENCVRIAKQMKEKMGISNIEFLNCSLEELSSRKFSTVLSARTFHENIRIRYTGYRFLPFRKQIEVYEDIYAGYCKTLGNAVPESGRLICIERNQMDTEFYSILRLFHSFGFQILPEGLKEIKCRESDFKEPSIFQTMIAEKNPVGEEYVQTEDELFQIWSSRAFSASSDPDCFTRSQADWFMENNAEKLIEGYASFDPKGTQLAKACLFTKKGDPDQFLMYQANYGKAGVRILPMEALEEAKEVFADHKIVDSARGFRIEELPCS